MLCEMHMKYGIWSFIIWFIIYYPVRGELKGGVIN